MSYENYWHSDYDFGQGKSEGLIRLLDSLPHGFAVDCTLDVGCARGRNIGFLRRYSRHLVGIEPNVDAAKSSQQLGIADTIVIGRFQRYCELYKQESGLIVGWRVLHLGTLEQCLENIDVLVKNLSRGGYLALALSDRSCPSFGKTVSEKGGIEIEEGTVLRTESGNDVRHFFTNDEILRLNNDVTVIDHQSFHERKGGSPEKFKRYHSVLLQKCQA